MHAMEIRKIETGRARKMQRRREEGKGREGREEGEEEERRKIYNSISRYRQGGKKSVKAGGKGTKSDPWEGEKKEDMGN